MCNKIFRKLIGACGFLFFSNIYPYSIVFVHLGPDLPLFLNEATFQARLFNLTEDIYLLANQDALNKVDKQEMFENMQKKINVKIILIESLQKSKEHIFFEKKSTHKTSSRKGFWRFTTEHFFVLDDFMQQYKINDVVHLESDTLLYRNLAEIMPVLRRHYKGVAAVFINEVYCIPCFVYFRNEKAIKNLSKHLAQYASDGENDMVMLSEFRKKNSNQIIDSLPIISKKYINLRGLKSIKGHRAKDDKVYYNHIDEFLSVFDGNAIGQFFGGADPSVSSAGPGVINKNSLFDPTALSYQWENDAQGRKVPFMFFKGEKYRINNLHIHSKNLKKFLSA